MVEALIQAGADVNAKYAYRKGEELYFRDQRKGWIPLMVAISYGDNGLSKLLIDAGSDLSYRNPYGNNALLMATMYVSSDPAEIVQSLVDAGADVNVSHEWNRMTFTPLMHAAISDQKEVGRILIAAGAEIANISPENVKECNVKEKIEEFLTSLEQ